MGISSDGSPIRVDGGSSSSTLSLYELVLSHSAVVSESLSSQSHPANVSMAQTVQTSFSACNDGRRRQPRARHGSHGLSRERQDYAPEPHLDGNSRQEAGSHRERVWRGSHR